MMRRATPLLKNNNLLRLFAAFVPIFVVLMTLVQFVQARNKRDEDDALPEACEHFALVSGNVNKARMIVLGENHVFAAQTFSCLYALAAMLKLGNNFKFYYEGPAVKPGEGSSPQFMRISQKAVMCKSWDDKEAFEDSAKMPVSTFAANYLHYLESLKLNDKKMHKRLMVDELTEYRKKQQKRSTVYVISLRNQVVLALIEALLQQYNAIITQLLSSRKTNSLEKFESSRMGVFDFLFHEHRKKIRNEAPAHCQKVEKNMLGRCIAQNMGHSKSNKKRDKSLRKNIKAHLEEQSSVRAFLIAGRKHVETVNPQDGLAVLQFKM